MKQAKGHLSDYPDLLLDWVQELNKGLDPSNITAGSHQKIRWHCHKCGREWYAPARSRINGTGCTCDARERQTAKLRKRLVERDGSLSQTRPEIAAQWHPILNGELTPDDITEKSVYKAWWIGEDGVAWQSAVNVRCKTENGTNRPKSLVIKGINDLKTLRPDLAAEWNYERNAETDIDSIMPGTKKRVWWICPKGHEWKASVISRNAGRGCRICSQERSTSFPEQALYYYVKQLFPDAQNRYYPEDRLELDIFLPTEHIGIEYDGGYYHRSERKKRIDAKKNHRLKQLGITLIRVVESGGEAPRGTDYVIHCERVNNHPLIDRATEELVRILSDITGKSLPIDIHTERDRIAIMEQYVLSEKGRSLAVVAPEVISEWHPIKNGKIKPEYVYALSNKQFWWKCRTCSYEWKAPVYRRAKGMGCPACSGNVVVPGLNDLATTRKDLVEEWNYDKNIGIDPTGYLAGSNKKVWWKCKNCGYEWESVIANRSRGNNCPRCAGKIVDTHKSLRELYPKIAEEWAYDLNGNQRPENYLPGSDATIWWRCSKGHCWQSHISHRVRNNNCPYCGNKLLLRGYNDFATVYPDMLLEWDEDNEIAPTEVLSGSNRKVKWICEKGHKWEAQISNRIRGNGCPYCSNRRISPGENDLMTLYPELAAEWHYDKNGNLYPTDVTPGSNRKVWWKCKKCSGEWDALIWSRVKGRGCPYCAGVRPTIGINDLKSVNPSLAEEWNYEKNADKDPRDYMPNSRAKVWWKCSVCGNAWEASIGARTQGRCKCPKCKY